MKSIELKRRQVEATQRWAARNRAKVQENWRAQGLKAYGLTPAAYDAMFIAQNGVCGICEAPPGRVRLAVDHDHLTGRVRGLLCANCNNGLGRFRDDPNILTRAAAYLEKSCTNPSKTSAVNTLLPLTLPGAELLK